MTCAVCESRPPRDEQIEQLVPIVEACVWKYVKQLPAHVDVDGVRGAAYEALVRAVDAWRPGRPLSIEKWVTGKVWFAMQDELRRQDFLTRGDRQAGRTDIGVVSLDTPARASGKDGAGTLTIGGTLQARDDIEEQVIMMDELRRLWEGLDDRERFVVQGVACGLTGLEIAGELGVSESRVSQIRRRAVATARAR